MNLDPAHLACLKIWSSERGFLAADGFVWVTDGHTACRLRAKTDTGNLYSADGVEWTTEGFFPPIAQVWKSPRGRHEGAVGVNMAFMLRVEATRKLLAARQVEEAKRLDYRTGKDRAAAVSAAKHVDVDVGFRFAGEFDPIAVTVGPDLEILIMPMRLSVGR